MPRSERVATYLTPEQKAFLEKQAKSSGISPSRYVARLVARDQLAITEDETSARLLAEERIRSIVNLGKDEMVEVARFIEDLVARMGCYSIANWKYLKKIASELDLDITDNHRRMFLRKAAKRLRKPIEEKEERVKVDWSEEE